jgi:hypothetical protein
MAHSPSHADSGHGTAQGGRAKPSYDDINVPILVMVGLVSTIVTFLIIATVQGLAYRMGDSFQKASNIDVRGAKAVRDLIDSQKALLAGGELGAKVPIDQAMDRVVERFSAGRATTAASEDTSSDHAGSESRAGSASNGHAPDPSGEPAAPADDH